MSPTCISIERGPCDSHQSAHRQRSETRMGCVSSAAGVVREACRLYLHNILHTPIRPCRRDRACKLALWALHCTLHLNHVYTERRCNRDVQQISNHTLQRHRNSPKFIKSLWKITNSSNLDQCTGIYVRLRINQRTKPT